MISLAQISEARASLRQAYELACMIEGMDGFAPDNIIERHRAAFENQANAIARKLGLTPGPRLAVDNDADAFNSGR